MRSCQYRIVAPASEVPKVEWRITEPKTAEDSVEHEQIVFREFSDCRIVGASVRGKRHAHFGEWREDAFYFDKIGPFTLLAVADGFGSSAYSRVGAQTACLASVRNIKYNLIKTRFERRCSLSDQSVLFALSSVIEKGVRKAVSALETESEKRGAGLDELATTLILMIFCNFGTRQYIGSFQVGDGLAVVNFGSGDIRFIGSPDFGRYAGLSTDLTSDGMDESLKQRITLMEVKDTEGIALMTDGISDDFFPLSEGVSRFFRETEQKIMDNENPQYAVRDWITYEKQGSYDDRTLLLLKMCR